MSPFIVVGKLNDEKVHHRGLPIANLVNPHWSVIVSTFIVENGFCRSASRMGKHSARSGNVISRAERQKPFTTLADAMCIQ